MLNELRVRKYIVEFFETGRRGALPSDSMGLDADNDSDAIEQAKWLDRHTSRHHFQVRVANGVRTIIYRSNPQAMAA
jgi:hypothetical protein